ncbi:MAG: hypothetical protein WCG14_00065 [Chlamydiia bacterium]
MSEQALIQQDDKETNSQIVKAIQNRNKKKIKATVYLTEEAEQAFTELYIHRLRKDRKVDRSMIACEAIHALFEKELGSA